MQMGMPRVAPLFIEDQDHESVLRMVNELKATVHATIVAKGQDGSVIAQQAVAFPGHTQQILRLHDLLERAGATHAIGQIQVVPNTMEVQSMGYSCSTIYYE